MSNDPIYVWPWEPEVITLDMMASMVRAVTVGPSPYEEGERRLILSFAATLDGLALALHRWRASSLSPWGCGWKFASEVDGDVLCPCPADAAAILALVSPETARADE